MTTQHINMTALEIVTDLINWYTTPSRWTKYHTAVDKDGKPCNANDENAKRFCIIGRLLRYADQTGFYQTLEAITAAIHKRRQHCGIDAFNDMRETTFQDIKEILADAKIILTPKPI